MRISDWSSDVCSSDLIGVSDHYADAGPRQRHDRTLRFAAVPPRRLPELPQLRARLSGQGAIRRTDRRRSRDVGHAIRARIKTDALARAVADLGHAARSDERRVGTEGDRTCRDRWAPYP